ncbi:MAG TPA: TolC family protein [Pyrinomonadaceae bacterium]|nr:TolC family protein [Pyrinomonadaceae bacterium]
MFLTIKKSNRGCFFKPDIFSCLLPAVAAVMLIFIASAFSQQQPVLAPTQPAVKLNSAQFVGQDGLNIERLIELGQSRRADLLAARQRLAIAEGRLRQAGFRPNPTLDTEYGSPRFLGGDAESDFSVGVTQVFELGGKRSRRVAVARLELSQIRAQVAALERALAVEIRTAYTNALAAARQLDVLERLIAADEELVRVTEARLKEGDVAPLDVNLVKVESDRLKVQAIQARSELETGLLQIRTLIGADIAESLRLAPQPERPPRFDTGISELTETALNTRPDLQAARLGEQLGAARIDLARANAVPNVAGAVRYSRSKQIFDFPPIAGGNFAKRDSELTFGVSIDIPVFNRNQGEIASATGERLQATRTREFLESAVKRDVAVAYRKYRAAAEALVIYSTQILPRAEANLQSVRAAYGLGDFSVFEVVNEQRRLTENVTNYNQVLRDYYNALTELETAIGGELPASGFSPGASSVLPDKELVPMQIDRAELLKSLQTIEIPKKSVSQNAEIKKTTGDEPKK